MRRVFFCCTVLVLAVLMVPGCSWFGTREEKPATAPTPANVDKVPPEAEVKPEPTPAPPAAAPPAVAPAPVTPAAEATRPASPAEQTKETLGPKPAQTAALAPPRSTVEPIAAKAEKPAKAEEQAPSPSPEIPAPKAEKSAAKTAEPAKGTQSAVAVVGDSLAVGIGMTMEQHLKHEGMGCVPLGKVSTGLISKRFFDWEKRLTELVAKEKLSAVVVMMGGNDANNSIAGKAAGTPEWGTAYREKAESFLRIAANAGVKVLWVGLPAMREPAYATRVKAVNEAARAACTTVPGCTYMEPSELFVDGSGKYVQAKDIGGKKVSLRAKDGVHMTGSGYDLLCRQVIDRLGKAGELPPKAQ